jgi:hypothetical protein
MSSARHWCVTDNMLHHALQLMRPQGARQRSNCLHRESRRTSHRQPGMGAYAPSRPHSERAPSQRPGHANPSRLWLRRVHLGGGRRICCSHNEPGPAVWQTDQGEQGQCRQAENGGSRGGIVCGQLGSDGHRAGAVRHIWPIWKFNRCSKGASCLLLLPSCIKLIHSIGRLRETTTISPKATASYPSLTSKPPMTPLQT